MTVVICKAGGVCHGQAGVEMNLTSFHMLFIGIAIALAFAFGFWAFSMYWSATASVGYLGTGVMSVLVGWALAFYLVGFVYRARRSGLTR